MKLAWVRETKAERVLRPNAWRKNRVLLSRFSWWCNLWSAAFWRLLMVMMHFATCITVVSTTTTVTPCEKPVLPHENVWATVIPLSQRFVILFTAETRRCFPFFLFLSCSWRLSLLFFCYCCCVFFLILRMRLTCWWSAQ